MNHQQRAVELLRLVAAHPTGAIEPLTRALTDNTPLVRHVAAIELAPRCRLLLQENAMPLYYRIPASFFQRQERGQSLSSASARSKAV
jgi:hypothetical protein